MDTHENYKRLLKRKLEGLRWLKKQEALGKDTAQDHTVFENEVLKPLAALRQGFTQEDAAAWDRVEHIAEMFNGKIILENGGRV
ncbi:MAG: hypothetical protein WC421_06515 [Elusimicrobiales bacterium]